MTSFCCRLMPQELPAEHAAEQSQPETLKDWRKWLIPEAHLSIACNEDGSEHLLGTGAFGAVYKGYLHGKAPLNACR